ncbi:hypothetical protein G4B88_030767 [Cannabis sativa]|uniref:Uncharacterized protein n=1 Tax=Cannabis sativa TaxID=3483 RepID=A0A7J6H8L2_CANSA|nr:hypothetical protein G4B88_030767 [Cannabis sativa]
MHVVGYKPQEARSNKSINGFKRRRPFTFSLFFQGFSYLQLNLISLFLQLFSLTIARHHQINHLLHFIPSNGSRRSSTQLHTHTHLLHQHL